MSGNDCAGTGAELVDADVKKRPYRRYRYVKTTVWTLMFKYTTMHISRLIGKDGYDPKLPCIKGGCLNVLSFRHRMMYDQQKDGGA
jgi:hypothetical protein